MEPNLTPSVEATPAAAMAPVTEVIAPKGAEKELVSGTIATATAQRPAPSTEITPETLMVMSASIAAYLGKTVRIRRVRFIDPHHVNAWGQASRVVLQSSHILRRDHS